jgi:hypothetical protein
MPLINPASQDETLSQFIGYDHETMAESSFGDVFDASLGLVVDEELSISGNLNREGWAQRKDRIDEMIRSGEIENVDKYRVGGGGYSGGTGGRNRTINYDKIAEDLGREDIKTNAQLNEDRNEMLRMRREYSQDVTSRGSGAAQFLGAMNAYMLDPVNILTVGVATPAVTAKATSTIARAMLATRNAAIIEGGAELGIQALVYEHKQDIDSPYSAGDALANIAMAATGAGILGGVSEGLSGWLKQVLKSSKAMDQTEELATAINYLERQNETLQGAPKVDVEQFKAEMLARVGKELSEELENVPAADKAKIKELKSDIKAVNKGIIPESLEKNFAEEIHAKQVESDVEYLKEMDRRATQYAPPSKDKSTYEKVDQPEEVKNQAPPATASQREREILKSQGLAETYDQEMALFDQLDVKALEIDGEMVDASTLVKQFDEEIQGLDDVLKCAYGGASSGGSNKLVSAFVGAFNAK